MSSPHSRVSQKIGYQTRSLIKKWLQRSCSPYISSQCQLNWGGVSGERRGETPLPRSQVHHCPAAAPGEGTRLTQHTPELGKRERTGGAGGGHVARQGGGSFGESREHWPEAGPQTASQCPPRGPGRSGMQCKVGNEPQGEGAGMGGHAVGIPTSPPAPQVPQKHTLGLLFEHAHGPMTRQRSNNDHTSTRTAPAKYQTHVTLHLPPHLLPPRKEGTPKRGSK